jgi:predicted dehydrogenase
MLKVGICGFGGLGHVHADSLAGMADVSVEAVCDIQPGQLAARESEINT